MAKPKPSPVSDITTCPCKGCQGMRRRYRNDPDLLAVYGKKLLQHGWAGELDEVERAYRRAHSTAARNASQRMKGRRPGHEH